MTTSAMYCRCCARKTPPKDLFSGLAYPRGELETVRHGVCQVRRCARTRRDAALVIGLTLIAGVVDALGYLFLGRVFVANMTGNLVLFAIALAQGHIAHAVRSIAALAGFMVGAAGSSALRTRGKLWILFAGETGLLWTSAWWWAPKRMNQIGPIIVLAAMAMGLQSQVAHRLQVAGATTTVITSTLTSLLSDLYKIVTGVTTSGAGVRTAVFLSYAAGALLAAWLRQTPVYLLWAMVALTGVLGLWDFFQRA